MERETTKLEKEVFEYLNELRESGVTNMFNSGAYVEREFNLDRKQAREIVCLWMSNFNKEGNYTKIKL